jgi:cation diffusion facilitator CzcD-associated flavoprotein CzcO
MSVKAGQTRQRTAAVIGAGPAGLVTAKTLTDKGFNVTVYEKGSVVGGTWVYDNDNGRNYLYRNLHINTSQRLTQFADFPFDSATQRIPDHRDMARYLKAYALHFDLYPLIRFKADVVAVLPPDAGAGRAGWTVQTAGDDDSTFDCVVVCTGPFARAAHVDDIRERFTGEYLHSSDYRAPEAFVGRRVCIVGAGNSAVDIASDICTTAAHTALVARSPVFVMPHFILGRAIGDIGALMQHRFIPAGFRRKVMGWLVRAVHGDMTSHGFKPLTHRVHATISSTIVQDILFERVAVKQGIADIAGTEIAFADGSRAEFDCIIAATGFVTEFPFLSDHVVKPVNNHVELYKRVAAPGWPGLYFVGMINLDTPINYACERQAQWIAALESEGLALPDEDDMRADIAAKRAWVETTFGRALRHSMQEDSVPYYAELACALKQARQRKVSRRGLPRITRSPRQPAEPNAVASHSFTSSLPRSTNP